MVDRLVAALVATVTAVALAACGTQDDFDRFSPGYPNATNRTTAGAPPSAPLGSIVPGTPAPSPTAAAPLPRSGSWARLEIDGPAPAPREDHTWTVDPDAGIAYLFGGRGAGATYDDVWAFDLATETWVELDVEGPRPPARFGHEAAWVPGRGLVIALGQAGSSFFNDVWRFDPASSTWEELPGAGAVPVARYGSCSGIGPDGRLWISHGFTQEGSRFFDTRAYDFAALAWADVTPPERQPVERCLHTCWWTADGQLALYGGQTTGVAALGDLWRLAPGAAGSTGTWTKLADPALAARQLPAMARRGDLTVVFGGSGIDRKPLADTWLLPDADGPGVVSLQLIGPSPAPRSGGALVYDAARDGMLLFGGTGEAALEDLWSLTFD